MESSPISLIRRYEIFHAVRYLKNQIQCHREHYRYSLHMCKTWLYQSVYARNRSRIVYLQYQVPKILMSSRLRHCEQNSNRIYSYVNGCCSEKTRKRNGNKLGTNEAISLLRIQSELFLFFLLHIHVVCTTTPRRLYFILLYRFALIR